MKSILYCNCSQANVLPDSTRKAALQALETAGVEYVYTDDLCGLCAEPNAELLTLLNRQKIMVLACFPRAVRALLKRAGLTDNPLIETVNLRTAAVDTLVKDLHFDGTRPGRRITLQQKNTTWQPWYPLIDIQRCQHCKQCLNFCLFGVYALDAHQHVRVSQPTHCKTGCPACARVCPCAAIIFPKYADGPINGDAVDEEAWKKTAPPEHLQQRLGSNVMKMLRNRTAHTATESLEHLKDQLNIPDSVIENLKKEHPR